MEKEKVENFIEAIIEVYETYGLSIAHEDWAGGFIIEPLSEYNVEWLKNAEY